MLTRDVEVGIHARVAASYRVLKQSFHTFLQVLTRREPGASWISNPAQQQQNLAQMTFGIVFTADILESILKKLYKFFGSMYLLKKVVENKSHLVSSNLSSC